MKDKVKDAYESSKNIYDAVKQNMLEHPDVEYVFELPQHSQTEIFIKFAENFSKEVLEKNIFTFKIKDN